MPVHRSRSKYAGGKKGRWALLFTALAAAASAGAQSSSPLALTLSPALSAGAVARQTTAGVAVPDASGGIDSLAAALAAAMRTEPRIREAERIAAASGFDTQAARSGFFPYATVGANQDDDGNGSTSLRIVQPLWNGGLTRAQVDGAREAERVALAEVDSARLEVGVEVLEAYLNLVAAETQIEQWDQQIQTLDRLVGVIQRRAEEGVAPDADVQTAVSRLRQAEAGREASRSQAASQTAELARLTGTEIGRVQWPDLGRQLSPQERVINEARLVEVHPRTVIARALIEQQRAEERRQRAEIWPELQLQYRADVEGVRSSQADGALLVLQYQTNNGLRGYRTAQAEAERTRAAAERLVQAKRDVVTRVRVAQAQWVAAMAQRRAQAAAVAATDVLIDSFLRQFEVGRKSWVEVLNASREANDTRLQAIAAERQFWSANGTLALESLQWHRLSAAAPTDDQWRDPDPQHSPENAGPVAEAVEPPADHPPQTDTPP